MGGWLLLLCAILTVWNPLALALRLSAVALNLPSMSTPALMSLAVRFILTSVGVSAGISLFMRRPWAVSLTKVTLVLFCVEAVARLSTRIGLSEAPPGTRLPIAVLLLAHNAAWYAYLQKSRRVRELFDLEFLPKP